MKTSDLVIREINSIVKSNRLVSDRIKALRSAGFMVKNCAMGSGGVGQIKNKRDSLKIQVSHGISKWNYAWAVELPI